MIVEQVNTAPPQPSVVGRARWVIIGAVAVLATGVGIVLGSVLVGGGGAAGLAPAAVYAPADAVMYVEARLDLPGTQREHLRALLDRFPAADPDSVVGEALARTLDEALADSGAPIDYSTDVAPWFDGTVAMVLLDYPMNMDPTQMTVPSAVGLFGVRDAAAAGTFADTLRAELAAEGATFTSGEHAGVTIWTLDADALQAPPQMEGVGFAYAIGDDQLFVANGAAAIEAALDARDGSGLVDVGEVSGLLAALPEERAGTMVMNSRAMIAEMRAGLDAMEPGLADALAGYLDALPPYSVASLAFGADAFLVDAASGVPGGALQPENGERAFAERLPADTLFYADGVGLGTALEQMIVTLKGAAALMPEGDIALAELENMEAAIGATVEEFVAWIGDGAMAAGWTGDAPWFGLVLEAADVDAASRRLTQIGALAELAAGQGNEVIVSTETVDGVEVTTVAFIGTGTPAFSDFAFAYGLDGETALIGSPGFVTDALTRDPADSLASAGRYATALGRFGGTDNAGAFFVDLAGITAAAQAALPDASPSDGELWANLVPLDYLAGVNRVDGDRVVSRIGLVLR